MEKTESYLAQQLEYELKFKELQKHIIELKTSNLRLTNSNKFVKEKYELQQVNHKKETEDLIQYFHDELENTNERSQTKIDKLESEIDERQRLVLELKTSNSKLEQLIILANQENESQKEKQESENMRKKAEELLNKKSIQIEEKDRVIENLVKREKELDAIIAKKDVELRLQAHQIGRWEAYLCKIASDRQSLTRMTKDPDLNWLSYI